MRFETFVPALLWLLSLHASSAAVDRTGKVVSDLASLCSSPLLEDLQELHRVEIREYNGSGYRVSTLLPCVEQQATADV